MPAFVINIDIIFDWKVKTEIVFGYMYVLQVMNNNGYFMVKS